MEPENRLVADTLERRWNEARARLQQLEQRLAEVERTARQQPRVDRAALPHVAEEFPMVWGDPQTDHRTKKRLLLLEEIVVRLPDEQLIELLLHWKGGNHTVVRGRKNRGGAHRHCTSREIVEVVRELARGLPDGQIARVLNRLGYRTGAGNAWTQARGVWLRTSNSIAVFDADRDGQSTLTMAAAASELGLSAMTVRRLIIDALLPARQPVPYAPWVIDRASLQIESVQRAVDLVKRGRPLPQTATQGHLTLMNSNT